MELKRAIAITTVLALLLATIAAAQQTTSTVNPNVPVPNTPVEQSGPLFRSNFQAVINDINELFRRGGSGFDTTIPHTWTGLQTFNGGAIVPTQSPGDSTTNAASTAFVASAVAALPPPGRIKLTSPLDLYANYSTGNDANNCLTAGTACKTAQAAYNLIAAAYDTAGQGVTIHLAANDPACLGVTTGWVGGGQISIQGPGGAGVQPTIGFVGCSANGVAVFSTLPANLNLVNLAVSSAGANAASILHQGLGTIFLNNVAFGSAGSYHMDASGDGAKIVCANPTTLTMAAGAAASWITAQYAASISCPGVRFVFIGTQTYGQLVYTIGTAPVFLGFSTGFCSNYSGTCTAVSAVSGQRFLVALNSVLDTQSNGNAGCGSGSGLNTIPGSTPGSCVLGGQYN